MTDTDVLIVGAGPAGATAAVNLAPARNVLLIDYRSVAAAQPAAQVGECLAPAARRLLTDMGIFESFLEQGHAPCYGNRAVWGGTHPVETDFLRDPDGHGWHLDRRLFDTWLRQLAVERGAALLAPARVIGVTRQAGLWSVSLTTPEGTQALRSRFLIDAGGQFAPLARRLGAKRHTEDRMVCVWMRGFAKPSAETAGFTFVEAVEDGWWYTAPIPGGRRILAFHTDADLLVARVPCVPESLMEKTGTAPALAAQLADCGFSPEGPARMTIAVAGRLKPPGGSGWLATGDAAVGFDPLSAQGLLNALFTGLAGAEAADAFLAGDANAFERYGRMIDGIGDAYRLHRDRWYGEEKRWPDAPFWARRQGKQNGGAWRRPT